MSEQTNKNSSSNEETGAEASIDAGSRERLLEVAVRLFAAKGLEGVTTRDLAGEAGVNISLISYYFGGKEGLYKTVIREFAEKAQEGLAKQLASFNADHLTRESYRTLMIGIVDLIVRFKLQSPRMSELMMREMLAGLPHAREVYEGMFNTMGARIIDLMRAAQDKGIVKPTINVHTLFVSMIHSMDCYFFASKCETPLAKMAYRFPEESDEYIQQLAQIFIDGVLT